MPPSQSSGTVLDAIGNTPVVKLQKLTAPSVADVLVKLEYVSPTGSYKDRLALAMVEGAEARGLLRPGMRVVEYTGGSTGSSLAMVCAVKGYPFLAVTSDAFAGEKLATMRAMGAELHIIPSDKGKITPELFDVMLGEAARLALEPGNYYTDQFNNPDAMAGYMPIGTELLQQVGADFDVFCGAVGTGGMLMGVSQALKTASCSARIVALEPASSPTLSTGKGGPHRVEGVGSGFWPPHLKREAFDEVRAIDEKIARDTARRLAREEGIFAGTSSGLNVAAALQLAQELGAGHTVVTVAVDSGLKYLAGDLYTG
jgi:cysteine synthase A